jgi:hypothetical protein
MTQENFLSLYGWRWLKITSLLVVFSIIWYFLDNPIFPKSGSTFYGYVLGIISAGAMLYLLWFGIRKRSYFSSTGTLKEMLSAHIWIGTALLVLVPLHCGFRFHFNVHTIAYIFCVLTIVTGIWGVYLYRTLPEQIRSNRGEGSLKLLLEQFESLNQSLRKLEAGKSDSFVRFVAILDTYKVPTLPSLLLGKRSKVISKEQSARALESISQEERVDALSAIGLIDRRFEFLVRIEHEALIQFWLKFWLMTHVPLACGSMLLLVVHIFSVLYFGKP